MKTHNSIPRCSKGAVWLKDKSDLKWHLFYLGTKDGDLKYTYYIFSNHLVETPVLKELFPNL